MTLIKKIGITKSNLGSLENRQELREKVMKDAISSKEAATEFLKNAGIINKNGNLSKHFK